MITSLRNLAEIHLEVARDCNLSCNYCLGARSLGQAPSLMPLGTAFDAIEVLLENTSCRRVEVIFHGGEPLLQTATWFNSVAQHTLRVAARHGKSIRFAMQSNCTLLSNEQLHVLSRFSVCVGSSIDGDAAINDSARGKSAEVFNNVRRLKEKGLLGNIICVLDNHNINDLNRVFSHFVSLGITSIIVTLRRAVGRGAKLAPLSPESIYEAYLDIFRFIERQEHPQILERTLASKLSRFINPPSSEDYCTSLICTHPICGGGITTIYCDTAGMLFPCGMSIHRPGFALGDFYNLDSKSHQAVVSNMYFLLSRKREQCNNCRAARICSFGCPAVDLIDEGMADAECKATKKLYRFFESYDRIALVALAKKQEDLRDGISAKY